MHAALVIYGDLETLSGGYLYDRHLVAHLRHRGHRVDILSLPNGSYLRHLAANYTGRLLSRLRPASLDILLEDELCHPSLFILNGFLRQQAPCPIVAVVHHLLCEEPGTGWRRSLYRLPERKFLRSVDGFIFNSRATEAAVERIAGVRPPSVVAYPSGSRLGAPLSLSDIWRRAHQDGPLRLLFLGNVIPRKGLFPLLEALQSVPRAKWHLSVVGSLEFDPPYTRSVLRLIRRRNLSRAVSFLGVLEENRLAETLAGHQLLCMPFAYEGFGIVVMEGMAFGLPAIVSSEGGAAEMIQSGANGFQVAPGYGLALSKMVEGLHDDRDRLAEMSSKALMCFRSHPKWEDSMQTVERFLTEIAAPISLSGSIEGHDF